MKRCTKCRKMKHLSQFSHHAQCTGGRNTQCKLCVNARSRRWWAANKERHRTAQRDAHFRRSYGITAVERDLLAAQQDGLCAICEREPLNHKLHVDHSHLTHKVRGLLCYTCNRLLGDAKDDVLVLRRAIRYLEERI